MVELLGHIETFITGTDSAENLRNRGIALLTVLHTLVSLKRKTMSWCQMTISGNTEREGHRQCAVKNRHENRKNVGAAPREL